jgi:hypothetical protein
MKSYQQVNHQTYLFKNYIGDNFNYIKLQSHWVPKQWVVLGSTLLSLSYGWKH